MVYTNNHGVLSSAPARWAAIGLTVAALVGSVTAYTVANAASQPVNYTEVSLTEGELTANWVVDRAEPSGGYDSVSFGGRDNVLEMRVDTEERSTVAPFYYTEGLKRDLNGPAAVKADLYVDSAWLDTNVRAGLWGVGHDASDGISAYPIIEFTTAGEGDFTGWRIWNGVSGGWQNLPGIPYSADSWNALELVFNDETGEFDYYVNGALAGSNAAGDSEDLGAVILNNYNYGATDGADYAVRWSNFGYGDLFANPESKDACKHLGWQTYGFANQGLCVQYVNTGNDSRL